MKQKTLERIDNLELDVSQIEGTLQTQGTQLGEMTSHMNTKEIHRKITFGTANPTGGADGDVYFQYV